SRRRHTRSDRDWSSDVCSSDLPLVDIAEDDKGYLIKVELPEVQKEDVKVTVESGTLTITGERKAEKEEKGRKFHRVERSYGRFRSEERRVGKSVEVGRCSVWRR